MSKVSNALMNAGLELVRPREAVEVPAAGPAAMPGSMPAASGALDPDFVKLYYAVEALRSRERAVVIQFVASTPGEGTSTVASQFARVAASESGQAVLFVDCDPHSRGIPGRGAPVAALVDVLDGGASKRLEHDALGAAESYLSARLAGGRHALLQYQGNALGELFDRCRSNFDITVLDCPAATQNPDSLALARYCDGTVLVVEAEKTRRPVIQSVLAELERFGGQTIGMTLNRRRQHIPGWLYHRL